MGPPERRPLTCMSIIETGLYQATIGSLTFYRQVTSCTPTQVHFQCAGTMHVTTPADFLRWNGERIDTPAPRLPDDYSPLSRYERQMLPARAFVSLSALRRRGWPAASVLRWLPVHDTVDFDPTSPAEPARKWALQRVEAAEKHANIVRTLSLKIRSKRNFVEQLAS